MSDANIHSSGTGSPTLELTQLVVAFGSRNAVDGLTVQIQPGEIVALLGPNGAGKSTTMGAIAGTLHPTSGTVLVCGAPPGIDSKKHCGFASQPPALYEFFTVTEHLEFVCDARSGDRGEIATILEQLNIDGLASRLCRELSFGMRQRVGLAAALIGPIKLALLDETLNGLDPYAMRSSKQVLENFAKNDSSILISTHMLDVADTLCSRILIVDQGKLKADFSADGLTKVDIEERYFEFVSDVGPT